MVVEASTHTERARAAIEAERARQIAIEGWTPEHDDAHTGGEMLRAADCYYREALSINTYRSDGKPMGWPWEDMWWKPKGTHRNLERAGALAMAEADRQRRANGNTEPAMHKLRIYIAALASRI